MPRLWPFLHHTSSSVRKSALLTLQKLTELDPSVTPMSAVPLQETLRHVYQRALVEHNPEVLHLIPNVWNDLLKSSRLDTLLLAACPMFGTWVCLAMQPARVAIDPSFLVASKPGVRFHDSYLCPVAGQFIISSVDCNCNFHCRWRKERNTSLWWQQMVQRSFS